MEEDSLLYQIKAIDKQIIRLFLLEENICGNFSIPTPTQFQIMEYILKHPNDSIYQKDLEDVLKLRRATVSGVLKTMEKNHLIKRVIGKQDARVKEIIMEEHVKNLCMHHLTKVMRIEKLLMQNISKQEQLEFMRILKKMQENINEFLKERTKENAKVN